MSTGASGGGPTHRRCDLLLVGGTVVTLDDADTVLAEGYVAVADGRVVALGTSPEAATWEALETIDCTGQVVMPGLYDCHTHLFQIAARGRGDNLQLLPWLSEFMIPMAARLTPDQAIALVELAALNSVLSGTVGVVDHHYGGGRDAGTVLRVAAAIDAAGMRGAVARVMLGRKSKAAVLMGLPDDQFDMTLDAEIAETTAAIQGRPAGSLVEVWPGPGNTTFVAPELLEATAALAREQDVRWHTHSNEDAAEIPIVVEVSGKRPIALLDELGILDGRATLAHCIHLDDEELDLLGASAATAVHNPISNGYLGAGTMPLRALEARGAAVALGTDGCAVAAQDMFSVMQVGLLLQRAADHEAGSATTRQLLRLATRAGARMLRVDAGSIELGKVADLITIDVTGIRYRPMADPAASIAMFGSGADVRTTVVNGRVVVSDGASTGLDAERIVRNAEQVARDVFA